LKKVMLLAAMLAMVLAAAAPALGQTANAAAGSQYNFQAVCQNVFDEINAAGVQYGNTGDLTAGGDLAQSIAQEQNVSVNVVNECLNTFIAGASAAPTVTATATAAGGTAAPAGAATAAAGGALPPTGGASLLALGAGALLVGGGLLARRIVR
jgi:hypothetical protein